MENITRILFFDFLYKSVFILLSVVSSPLRIATNGISFPSVTKSTLSTRYPYNGVY